MFVHRWELERLIEMLGPFASGFHLDAWVADLEKQQTTVLLHGQRWPWIQQQLAFEIARRGLPTGNEPRVHWRDVCPHEPRCGNGTNCANLTIVETARKERGE